MPQDSRFESIPVCQIRPNCLLIYNQRLDKGGPRSSLTRKLAQLGTAQEFDCTPQVDRSKAYSGDMTRNSQQRLKKAINTLVAIAEPKEAIRFKTGKRFKFRVNFITLTLPCPQGVITDKELKKLALDPFLKRLKRKHNLKSYVWKAEKQENGNLHFHLTTDTYIHFEHLRNEWNGCLARFGYIEEFKKKHGHDHPNSTDVHSVQKVKNLAAYMIKYMAKSNKEGQVVDGKLWDCSMNLKQKIRCELVIDNDAAEWLEMIVKKFPDNLKNKEHVSFIYLSDEQFSQFIIGRYHSAWEEWRKRVRDFEPVIRSKKKVQDQQSITPLTPINSNPTNQRKKMLLAQQRIEFDTVPF